jgi:hypothetical protein
MEVGKLVEIRILRAAGREFGKKKQYLFLYKLAVNYQWGACYYYKVTLLP